MESNMKAAVILSGCGVYDGSEIHETVLTLLSLAQEGVQYQCFSLNKDQRDVVNHVTGEAMAEKRNMMVEAARLSRGDIKDLAEANVDEFDFAIFPGGFGAAKNLCDFAVSGVDCSVDPHIVDFIQRLHAAGKPMGFMCISPVIAAKVLGQGYHGTIGKDKVTAEAIQRMGATHVECDVDKAFIDAKNKIVSTPAYMLGQNIADIFPGIQECVRQTKALTRPEKEVTL